MPRVKYFGNPEKNAFADSFVSSHGDLLSAAVVGRALGMKNYQAIYEWLNQNNVTEFSIGGRKRFSAHEVAAAIWEART